jgi:hypothetical protein
MTRTEILAALALAASLLGACSQEPYIKTQGRSGHMLNAAEVDNQARRRNDIEAFHEHPEGTPVPDAIPVPHAVPESSPVALP